MKKQYRKPEIAIEDFVLNQFIAGSCTVKTNLRDTCYSANYDEWSKELDPFTLAAIEAGQFIENLSCTNLPLRVTLLLNVLGKLLI